jgi:hypothetical protein
MSAVGKQTSGQTRARSENAAISPIPVSIAPVVSIEAERVRQAGWYRWPFLQWNA